MKVRGRGGGCGGVVDDTLGRGGAEVANHIEGGFEMLFVGAAAVGGQEGHRGGKVGASVGSEPCEAANQRLVGFLTLDIDLVVLAYCCQWDEIDGTA